MLLAAATRSLASKVKRPDGCARTDLWCGVCAVAHASLGRLRRIVAAARGAWRVHLRAYQVGRVHGFPAPGRAAVAAAQVRRMSSDTTRPAASKHPKPVG